MTFLLCVWYMCIVYLKLAKIVLRQESKAKQSKMWVKAVASMSISYNKIEHPYLP